MARYAEAVVSTIQFAACSAAKGEAEVADYFASNDLFAKWSDGSTRECQDVAIEITL